MTPDLSSLTARLSKVSRTASLADGRRKAILQQRDKFQLELEQCRQLDVAYQCVQKFFQNMGTHEQIALQQWFQNVMTYGIQSVFGSAYRFLIIGPEVKNNEIAVSFKVVKRFGDSEIERDPFDEMGGGVADVVAFLLQFVMVYLLRDRVQPILFLDEAFKHLADEYVHPMTTLIRELVDKTGVQIVMVTHEPEFATVADKVYRFTHDGVETKATLETVAKEAAPEVAS